MDKLQNGTIGMNSKLELPEEGVVSHTGGGEVAKIQLKESLRKRVIDHLPSCPAPAVLPDHDRPGASPSAPKPYR